MNSPTIFPFITTYSQQTPPNAAISNCSGNGEYSLNVALTSIKLGVVLI